VKKKSPKPPATTEVEAVGVSDVEIRSSETVPIERLKPHPRNYKGHPADQVQHLAQSLKEHGWYRSVVTASDYTVLAGHGIIAAAKSIGLTEAPVIRLPLDPLSPRALKLLATDNEIGKFGETDDRALTELLREIKNTDPVGLFGTGFDDQMLAALVMVTRPASEIEGADAAKEWVGMPEYDPGDKQIKLIISFLTLEDRERFVKEKDIRVDKGWARNRADGTGLVWSTRWPFSEREDVAGLTFEPPASGEEDAEAEES